MRKYRVSIPVLIVMLLMVVAAACNDDKSESINPELTGTEEALTLIVNFPQDEAVVDTSRITVSGTTRSDAVVSINGAITDVNSQSEFSSEVNLETGPNLIEVVASDFEGHSSRETITIIYIPK